MDLSYIDLTNKLRRRDVLNGKKEVGLNTRRDPYLSKTVILPAISNEGSDKYNLL